MTENPNRFGNPNEPENVPAPPANAGINPAGSGPASTNHAGTNPADENRESRADKRAQDKPQGPSINRILIWVGAALVALYFIGDGVIGLIKGDSDEPQPTVTQTETAAAPTPTQEAIDRGETTAFGAALPDSSRQYSLSAFEPTTDWIADDANEAFLATYTGPLGTDTATFEVFAAQFVDSDEALAAFKQRTGQGTEVDSGVVQVAGETTGSYLISTADSDSSLPPVRGSEPIPAGTARALWTNGTALFEAFGPEEDVVNFYKAFAL